MDTRVHFIKVTAFRHTRVAAPLVLLIALVVLATYYDFDGQGQVVNLREVYPDIDMKLSDWCPHLDVEMVELVRLTRDCDTDRNPVWSPLGDKIAFECRYDGFTYLIPIHYYLVGSDICIMNADGSGRKRLTEKQDNRDPAWSPDGSKIAFASWRGEDSGIAIMNAEGSILEILTVGYVSHPTWSPDGSQIAYSDHDGDVSRIYITNVDGSGTVAITDWSLSRFDPVWSPDGSKIAFTARGGEESDIYLVNPDGTGNEMLLKRNGYASSPAWSSDSKYVVFAYHERKYQNAKFCVVSTDGSGFGCIRYHRFLHPNPSLSPDGNKLVFEASLIVGNTRRGNPEIFVIELEGRLQQPRQ